MGVELIHVQYIVTYLYKGKTILRHSISKLSILHGTHTTKIFYSEEHSFDSAVIFSSSNNHVKFAELAVINLGTLNND